MNGERWQRIEGLFHAALAFQPRDRGAFLAENCVGDDELRREIEELIASHETPKDFIERDASDLAAEMLAGGSIGLVEGQSLGPYKIVALLGAGGMGQVFRATDTRLHRTVTIKILSGQQVSDLERKRRFLQEARAASALNHPSIVTIYDIANDGDRDYLVMEYVEGKTLDKLMAVKPLPLTDAIGYGVQIASALAAAHSAGIVHRDIKPGNVIVTPQSQVKVLDFGLAKLMEREEWAETETAEGTILGTPAYMSPEQADGRQVDHRTDIFSLGVTLYEMIAGRRPFAGKSHVDTLHEIIHVPAPPLAKVPARLAEIIDKALAKDPRERYQNAGDLAVDLRRFLSKTDSRARRARLLVAGLVMVVAAMAAWLAFKPEVDPLEGATFTELTNWPDEETSPALSPDGKFAAFLSNRKDSPGIWVKEIGTADPPQKLLGTKDGAIVTVNRFLGFTGDGSAIWRQGAPRNRFRLIPFPGGGDERPFLEDNASVADWSPNGKRVVYNWATDGDPIFVTNSNESDPPKRIFSDPDPEGHSHYPTWSPDGRWIYFVNGPVPETTMDLWRIPSDGGPAERLTQLKRFMSHPTPIDARTVLYLGNDWDGTGPWLWKYDVASRELERVPTGTDIFTSISAASHGGNYLIASRIRPDITLWSVPILDRIAEDGDVNPYPVQAARALMPRFGKETLFYVSSDGGNDGLWRLGKPSSPTQIWKDSESALLVPPAISRDGSQAAVVVPKEGKLRLRLIATDGSQSGELAETLEIQGSATWSPDRKWIAIGGNDGDGDGLFKVPVDGGRPIRLTRGKAMNPVWSPDDSLIVYAGPIKNARQPLQAVRPDGTAIPLLLTVHPNGTAIPLPGEPILLGVGGERMQFMADGKRLIYMQGGQATQNFVMLDLNTMKTRRLTNFLPSAIMRTFDITPDGKEIVFDRRHDKSDIVLVKLRK